MMKIKENYVIQKIEDDYLVIPLAEESDRLHGILKLNETGAYLWNILINGINNTDELVPFLIKEYKVDRSRAHEDVEAFICKISAFGCLEGLTE